MGVQRMDKLLSDTGRWSRKEAKELIRKGQVLVNGKTVRKPEEKADPEQAQMTVCGEVVPWQAKCYLLLHKPAASSLPPKIGGKKPCWNCFHSPIASRVWLLWDGWQQVPQVCCCSPMMAP